MAAPVVGIGLLSGALEGVCTVVVELALLLEDATLRLVVGEADEELDVDVSEAFDSTAF